MKKLGKALIGLFASAAMLASGFATATTAVADTTTYPTTTLKVSGAVQKDKFSAYRLLDSTESGNNVAYYLRTDTTGGRTDADSTKAAAMTAALQTDTTLGLTKTDSLTKQAQTAVDAFAKMDTGNSSTSDTTKFGPLDKWAKAFIANNSMLAADYADVEADATGVATFSNVQQGYYIVVQTASGTPADGSATAYTIWLVDTAHADETTITVKKDVPTLTKKVQDVNDSDTTATDNNTWQDSADHDVNDTVKFQLTGTLPKNYAAFDSYKYIFHDYQSAGLTFNQDSVKVYAVNKGGAKYLLDAKSGTNENGYEVQLAAALGQGAKPDETFRVTFADLKKVTSGKLITNGNTADTATNITIDQSWSIVVEYESTLNANAVIGPNGNPDKANLEYSNKYDTPGNTVETPKDKVIVFTYELDINKVTGEGEEQKPLAGATFKLEKWYATSTTEGEWKTVDTIATSKTSDGKYTSQFKRVDDGKYRLTETVVPAGFKGIDPIEFTITATHSETADEPRLLTLTTSSLTGATGDVNTGVITGSIKNTSGSELPSTGGMGTVILYVAGAACVIAAGVWFALRRRSTR